MKSALNAVGDHYGAFQITKYQPLPELQSTLIELVHEPTGAKVLHIANDDPENVFCLSFQTLPTSSNGVAHILEHTVLCGSKKFPVKDPFFAMTRRSLHTFMNAFTGQDFTCYPASSQVPQDFYNLLEVYLDAVFHPQLKHMSFLQEGHRLAFREAHNEQSPLVFHGVVYNEMKGAMMSAESRLHQAIAKYLTPNLPYSHNSGGDPKEIPDLSYEELIEFHRDFYHPSHCLFYFYGNLPLQDHLDFIEEKALSNRGKIALAPPLPKQPRFKSPVHASEPYPFSKSEDPTDKYEVAFSWLTAKISDQADVLALSLIDTLLMETDVSPLKKALLKSGFCHEAESSIDVEMREIPLSIICKGCKSGSEGELKKVLFQTLNKIASSPISQDRVEAALHQLELQRTEISSEGGPFGLHLFMRAGLLQQHGSDPASALQIHSLFSQLSHKLKNRAYLPNLIRRYLIDNPHFVSLVLKPDPNLEEREQAEEKQRLEILQSKLTPQQKLQIIHESEALEKYQESTEHQSLECLPKIALADVPQRARDFALTHHTEPAFELYHHDCFTNQFLYAELIFDVPDIAQQDLPLLSLLSKLWTELGTGGRSHEKTLHFMESHTGGIDANLALHVSAKNPDSLKPAFSLRGKALFRKSEEFFQLLTDFSHGSDFADRERIGQWLLQHATELDEHLASNPLNYSVQQALCGFSTASYIYNQWHGYPYHQFIQTLVKDSSDAWVDRLASLAQKLISGKPHLILSCQKSHKDQLLSKRFYALGKRAITSPLSAWVGNYPIPAPTSAAHIISSPVAFTALGMRTCAYSDPSAAPLMLATELLSNVFLHKEVREKGGAYGSGASYAPSTGNFHFYSYRDPHLSTTLQTFHKSIDIIAEGSFTDNDLEEAKLGLIASLDTPVPPSNRAAAAYAWLRAERTFADRQHLREQILSTSRSHIMHAVERLKHLPSATVSFLGEPLWEKEKMTKYTSELKTF